jgi:hypothetical protein
MVLHNQQFTFDIFTASWWRAILTSHYQRDGHPAPSEFAPAGLLFASIRSQMFAYAKSVGFRCMF